MVDDSGRTCVRADSDSVLDIPLTQQHPANAVENPPDGILLDYLMAREEGLVELMVALAQAIMGTGTAETDGRYRHNCDYGTRRATVRRPQADLGTGSQLWYFD